LAYEPTFQSVIRLLSKEKYVIRYNQYQPLHTVGANLSLGINKNCKDIVNCETSVPEKRKYRQKHAWCLSHINSNVLNLCWIQLRFTFPS